ncbi:MAG: hypothetical protein QOI61_2315 [Actinomycetota bacterium]|jgi:hypothetical protein
MTQYLLSVWGGEISEEEMKAYMASGAFEETGKLNDELAEQGKLVFAGGLEKIDTSTSVRYDNGNTMITDGPYAEIKENMGGFWILECQDLDEALAIAKRAAVACQGSVEVRPFQSGPPA